MQEKTNIPSNIEGLAALLVLQDQIKELNNLKEFGFFVTNETHRLIHYHTAYLWSKSEVLDIKLLSQSEVADIDTQSPMNQWVAELIQYLLHQPSSQELQGFDFAENSKAKSSNSLLKRWPETLPTFLLWSPFFDSTNKIMREVSGGLILFREKPFAEQEVKMFKWLAKNYQYTWIMLTTSRIISLRNWFKNKTRFKLLVLSAILFIALFPTRISVVANAIVESKEPALINSPIPGIIKEFLVKPGDNVVAGQLLVTLDKNDLAKTVEVDQRKVDLAEEKLRNANMQSYEKPEIQSEIPILEAELAIDLAELDFSKSLLSKTNIYSPIDGIAVFNSKEDWIGQPVQAGENILTIENPGKVELKITLPVQDNITLGVGAEGKFYMFGRLVEMPVVIATLGYDAKTTPNKVLAYQLTANFTEHERLPPIGSQGMVHLYGRYVPFIYFLIRKPLQAIRQTFGIL